MLLSNYRRPPLTWTSQKQQLQEVYRTECAALAAKPNSLIASLLVRTIETFQSPDRIVTLDFSGTVVGRKGVLALLGVVRHCPKLQSVLLKAVGADDFSCATIAAALRTHPTLVTVDLRGNNITGDSVGDLQVLAGAWCERERRAAVVEQRHPRHVSVLLDEGLGVLPATARRLASVDPAAPHGLPAAAGGELPTFAPACRPAVILEELKRKLLATRPSRYRTEEMWLGARRMKHRLLVNDYVAKVVPAETAQLSADRWLILSVFISCAFNEFHEEAAIIHRVVFPRANRRLRPYRIYLVPVMLHAAGDEQFAQASTRLADGKQPIDYTRLPPWRKSTRHVAEDKEGRRSGVMFNEEGAHASEVRALLVGSGCDVFVGLYSDQFVPAVNVSDWAAKQAIDYPVPAFVFRRRPSGVPAELAHLCDYRKSLEMASAAHNLNVGSRSFGVRDPAAIKAEIAALVEAKREFDDNVRAAVPACAFTEYEASFARVDNDGDVRFHIDERFLDSMLIGLVAAGHAYMRAREGGSAAMAGVFDPTVDDSRRARRVHAIPRQQWTTVPASPTAAAFGGGTFEKDLCPVVVAPFKSEEELLRIRHGVVGPAAAKLLLGLQDPAGDDPFGGVTATGIEEQSQRSTAPSDTTTAADSTTDIVAEAPFCAIVGPAGSGKSTQLRAVAAHTILDPLAVVAKHSVCHGKRTLAATMVGLLQQLYRRYSEDGGSVFAACPLLAQEHDRKDSSGKERGTSAAYCESLVAAFCGALRDAPLVSPFSTRICLFIDDDDAADVSFAKLFLDNPEYHARLCESAPSAECTVRIFFTTRDERTTPIDGLLLRHDAPRFSETEAADLFVYYALGTSPAHPKQLAAVKAVARSLVAQKKDATLPLYMYLAAREMAFYQESTPMHAIAEVLPDTVEGLAATAVKVALPPDLETVFEALATAPEPFCGAMLRFAINAYRCYPHVSEETADRFRWHNGRVWGRFTEPLDSSAGLLAVVNANFCHLLEHCDRPRGVGFLTHRWSTSKSNVWRTPWRLASRTVHDAVTRLFDPDGHRNAPTMLPSSAAQHMWGRPLRRLAYMREGPFTARALCNIVDARYFTASAHRLFGLLDAKAFDDLIMLLEGLRLDVAASPPTMRAGSDVSAVLEDFIAYLRKYWPQLRRHRAFLYCCPQEAPALLRERLLRAAEVNPCARLVLERVVQAKPTASLGGSKRRSTVAVPAGPRGSVALAPAPKPVFRTRIVTTLRRDVAASFRTVEGVRPHELSTAMVDRSASGDFGMVRLFCLGGPPHETPVVAGQPHEHALCNAVVVAGTDGPRATSDHGTALDLPVHVVTAAFFDPFVVVSGVTGDWRALTVLTRHRIDNPPRAPLALCAVATADPLSDARVPMWAVAAGDVLVISARRERPDDAPSVHKFDGHTDPIVACGFSPGGCSVWSLDASCRLMVWGAPHTPFCGTITAVTTLPALPLWAKMVHREQLLYATGDALCTWHASTSEVHRVVEKVAAGGFGTRFGIDYAADGLPNSVCAVDTDEGRVKWYLPQAQEKEEKNGNHHKHEEMNKDTANSGDQCVPRFELDVFAAVQQHVSTTDAVGNSDLPLWRWACSRDLVAAVDVKEGMLKLFTRASRRQVPMFFAVPDPRRRDYRPASALKPGGVLGTNPREAIDDGDDMGDEAHDSEADADAEAGAGAGSDEPKKRPAVFQALHDCCIDAAGDRVLVGDQSGAVHVLRLFRGPHVYPSDPYVLE